MANISQELKKSIVIGIIYSLGCPHCTAVTGLDSESKDREPTKDSEWGKLTEIIKNDADTKDKIGVVSIEAKIYDGITNNDKDKETYAPLISNGTKIVDANGYPTIFKLIGQKVEFYEGERTALAMKKWASESTNNMESNMSKTQGGKAKKTKHSKKHAKKHAKKRTKKQTKKYCSKCNQKLRFRLW